jgi:hypothetical protein
MIKLDREREIERDRERDRKKYLSVNVTLAAD